MYLEYTPEQRELSRELRAYFARLLTPEVREALGGTNEDRPAYREIIRQIGKDGLLGLGWPTEYGGQGRPAIDQYILFDEINRAQAPFPFVTINNIGPMLMRYGTEEQKRTYLPGMLTGDVIFAIGYSEPGSGTDLASLSARAEATPDGGWVVNGQKVFTSGVEPGRLRLDGRAAPTPAPRSTRASPSSSCRRRTRASAARRSPPAA